MKAKWKNEEGIWKDLEFHNSRFMRMRKWRQMKEWGRKKWDTSSSGVAKALLDTKFQDLYRLHSESFDPCAHNNPEYLSYFQRQRFSQISEPVWWLPVFLLRSHSNLEKNKSHPEKPLKDASHRFSSALFRLMITQLWEKACKRCFRFWSKLTIVEGQ